MSNSYALPDSVDTGHISAPSMPNMGNVFGDALSKTGEIAGQIGAQNDQAAVNEAMTQFQNHIRNVQYGDPDNSESVGFLTLQGKSAMSGWEGALQDIDTARKQIAQTLTPSQQRMYGEQSASLQNSAFNGMASHVANQRAVWVRQSNGARIDQLGDTAIANRSDPAAMQSAITSQMQIADQQSAAEGLPLNDPIAVQRRAAIFDTTGKKMVRAYLADNDPIGAQHFVEANGTNFSPEMKNDLAITLRHPVIEKSAEIWARQEFGPALQTTQPISRDADLSDVLVSQEHAESGGRQFDKNGSVLRSMPNDPDSPRGIMQIKPSTAVDSARYAGIPFDLKRLDTDAAYNRGLGHAEMYRLCQKYGNNLTLACAAYNWGQGNVDKALRNYGDPRTGAVSDADFLSHAPRETQTYVTKIQSGLEPQQPPPSHTAPDFEGATRRAMAGPDWEENMAKLSEVSRVRSIWDAETQTARTTLSQTLANLNEQRLHGNMAGQFPPEAAQLLSAPEWQAAKDRFDAASDAGSQWKAVQWMPPAQQQAYLEQRENALQNTDTPHYALLREGMNQLFAQVKRGNAQLQADPASYVQSHPAMQQAASILQDALQSEDQGRIAEAQKSYLDQSTALQRSLGIDEPCVMTAAQSQNVLRTMSSLDLSKDDPRAPLLALKQEYGPYAHQAMGDLVKAGLSPSYMLMDNLSEPAAEMFGAALKQGAGKPDAALKVLRNSVDPSVRSIIEPPASQGPSTLDAGLSPLYATFRAQGAPKMVDDVKAAATLLAYQYASRNVADPVGQAVRDFTEKYDIAGAIRAPKGTMATILPQLQHLASDPVRLNVAMIDSSNPALTASDKQALTQKRIADRPVWVTNGDETGYVLTVPSIYAGHSRTVMGRDGKPVTVRLKDLLDGQYMPAGANPYADGMMQRQSRKDDATRKEAAAAAQQDRQRFDWSELN